MRQDESEPSRDERIASGEICKTCGSSYPGGVYDVPGPINCGDCGLIFTDDEEVSHSSLVRCPKCGHAQQADDETMWTSKSHSQTCEKCDTDYNVEIDVAITYTSPPRSIEAEEGES